MDALSQPWFPGFVTGTLALIAAISSGFITSALQARREKAQRAAASGTPGVPTVQEIWKRQDSMEQAFRASLVLLGEVVEQHAEPHKLVLSKSAVKTLRESGYMPPELEEVLSEQDKEQS